MLILFIITLVLVIYYFSSNYNESLLENFYDINLYKCPRLNVNQIHSKIIQKYNIKRINNIEKCNIYIPCGYNNVENELKKVKLYNNTQKIYGISGCDFIVSKNGIWNLIESRYGRHNAQKLMPETFVLNNPQHIELFKKTFNKNNIYLLKKNIQRKLGIELSSNLNFILSKINTNFKIVQKYIPNLYLVNKRKINLRLYLLIVCKNKKVKTYLHKLGKCIYTNKDIDYSNNFDKEKHLTSLNLNKNVYKTRPETFCELKKYLGNKKYRLLFNNIYKNLTYVIKSFHNKICKLDNIENNLSFQLFGLDYIFDNKMNVYLLEMNKGPDMSIKSLNDPYTKEKVLTDVFKLTNVIIDDHTKNLFNEITF